MSLESYTNVIKSQIATPVTLSCMKKWLPFQNYFYTQISFELNLVVFLQVHDHVHEKSAKV